MFWTVLGQAFMSLALELTGSMSYGETWRTVAAGINTHRTRIKFLGQCQLKQFPFHFQILFKLGAAGELVELPDIRELRVPEMD